MGFTKDVKGSDHSICGPALTGLGVTTRHE